MCLYFYSEHQSASSDELYTRLTQLRCDGERLAITKVSSVESRPDLAIRVGDIVVLFADSTGELDAIISKRDIFLDCRLILVLPDREEETIHKSHVLRPRFMDFKDSDQRILFKVLQKLAAQNGFDSTLKRTALKGLPVKT